MTLRRVAALVAVAALVFAACSQDEGVLEEGGPRPPSDAGIATDVTLDRIQIDGKRTYQMHEAVESFTTRAHQITPLLSWEGKYVHIGVDDDKRVRWIAGIGLVSGKPPRVTYSGIVEDVDDSERTVTFEDGTVLELAPSVESPRTGNEVVAEIDANRDLVVRIVG